LVVGQAQHHALPRVLDDLAAARGPGDDDALCRHLFFQAWQELGRPARVLLAYLGAATRAPQLPGQLLGLAPADDLRFDARTLDGALGELSRWFLLERAEGWEPGQEPAYAMHPLTRAFVLSDEIRARWEREVAAADLHDAARRQHDEILRRGLGAPGRW
ncbi:MAG TPA: hypothetical protein VFW96_18695, partial [Thermomicrobiales bacterium]|nr:hypothetical protein [Thermomicrobiales bacterium]